MKRKRGLLVFIAMCILVLSLPLAAQAKTETLKKKSSSIVMLKGTDVTLQLSGSPKAKWTIKGSAFSIVSSKLHISGKKKGTTVIYAEYKNKTYTCKVKVEDPSISATSKKMHVGDKFQLKMNGTTQKVSWSTKNKAVAKVSKKGLVTAVWPGETYICAKIGEVTFKCKIKVLKKHITKVILNKYSLNMAVGDSATLKATYEPKDTTDDTTVKWSSSDTSVVTVKKGVVKAKKLGTANVTAKIGCKEATCKVVVDKSHITSIKLSHSGIAGLKVGQSAQLTVSYAPLDTTDDKTVTWTSSNPSVATVSGGLTGTVKAVSAGKTTITAEMAGKKAECTVEVIPVSGWEKLTTYIEEKGTAGAGFKAISLVNGKITYSIRYYRNANSLQFVVNSTNELQRNLVMTVYSSAAGSPVRIAVTNTTDQTSFVANTTYYKNSFTGVAKAEDFNIESNKGYDVNAAKTLCANVFNMGIAPWRQLIKNAGLNGFGDIGFTRFN